MTTEDDDKRLARWAAQLTVTLADAGFPVDDLEVDVDAVLGLAGRAAHAVIRPAAPLTTFIVGYAAGAAVAAGRNADEAIADATRTALTAAEHERGDHASAAQDAAPESAQGSAPAPEQKTEV
jgi:hypothetical protein